MPDPVLKDPLTLETLGDVRAHSLIPAQQPSSQATLVSADTYQQRFLKYPERGIFHSYAEFIHAILLESRQSVTAFVPHPFVLHVKNRRYIPDCYRVENGERVVVELKSRTDTMDPPPELLERFFSEEGIAFQLIPNEEVMEHEAEARHWLRLIQVMVTAARYGVDTQQDELDILQLCQGAKACVADMLTPGRRDQWQREIALYRLLHQHRLRTDLKTQYLDYDSELVYVDNVA